MFYPAITLAAALLAAVISAPAAAQGIQVLNNEFDPYTAVVAELPSSAFSQTGSLVVVTSIDANISTFRIRETGKVEHYVKLTIEYPTQPQLGEGPINADAAYFQGGVAADFEKIDGSTNCVSTRLGNICKNIEVLSVRLPNHLEQGARTALQFRNRGTSWRGTIEFDGSLLRSNRAKLPR